VVELMQHLTGPKSKSKVKAQAEAWLAPYG
jgi:hypothetical protein